MSGQTVEKGGRVRDTVRVGKRNPYHQVLKMTVERERAVEINPQLEINKKAEREFFHQFRAQPIYTRESV